MRRTLAAVWREVTDPILIAILLAFWGGALVGDGRLASTLFGVAVAVLAGNVGAREANRRDRLAALARDSEDRR